MDAYEEDAVDGSAHGMTTTGAKCQYVFREKFIVFFHCHGRHDVHSNRNGTRSVR